MDIQPATTTGFIPEFTLGDRLRKVRDVLGLDREQFAALGEPGDFTWKQIANYEVGLTKPKTYAVRALAEMAGVDFEWLLTGKTPTEPQGPDGGVPSNVTKLPGLDSNQEPIGRDNTRSHNSRNQTRGNLKDDLQKAA